MREIQASKITEVVKKLCIEANCYLPADLKKCIEDSRKNEPWPQAQEILDRIIENYEIAEAGFRPICQDTGLACVFVKMGQEVHVNGDLSEAIHEDMDTYFRANAIALRDEMAVRADYYENNHEEYNVRLRVMEKKSAVIDLTLSVPTESQANSICDNWKKKNQKLYAYLMQELL